MSQWEVVTSQRRFCEVRYAVRQVIHKIINSIFPALVNRRFHFLSRIFSVIVFDIIEAAFDHKSPVPILRLLSPSRCKWGHPATLAGQTAANNTPPIAIQFVASFFIVGARALIV